MKLYIPKSLDEKSIDYLQDFLKKYKRRLLPKQLKIVDNLIEKKREYNKDFADKLVKNPVFYLALRQLERRGTELENVHPARVLIMMVDIINKSHSNNLSKDLNDYCEGFEEDRGRI